MRVHKVFAMGALASALLLNVTGCGGGGDAAPGLTGGTPSTPSTPGTPAGPTTVSVPVTVVDGPIANAVVCLDKNLNGACDSSEPSGKTDASGNVSLQVDPADAGKYPIVAVVGTDAVDQVNGPVTTPFTLKAPADRAAVVSPLTTLVQSMVETTGSTSTDAETALKTQIGVNVSLFDDFTRSTTTDSQLASTVARMVVVATQQQATTLAGAVGTTAIDGSLITQTALNTAIQQKMVEILPTLVAAVTDSTVQAATSPSATTTAMTTLATSLLSTSGITTSTVTTVVAINNQATSGSTTSSTPASSASLRSLTFNSATDWIVRIFTQTAAQNTPDSSGNLRYVDRRARTVDGNAANYQKWNTGSLPNRQSDLHWNGSAWVNCGFNGENVSSVPDAQGNSTYDYCDKLETGRSNRAAFDVSGKSMIDVYNQATAAGYANLFIANASSMLGSATFPANSKLIYQTSTPLTNAVAYYPGIGNTDVSVSALAAAGDSTACASITPSTPLASYTTPTTTLEQLVAVNGGTPCVYGANSMTVYSAPGTQIPVNSGTPNEWWGNSTVELGVVGTAPVGNGASGPYQTSYYTTNTSIGVSFAANNAVKYYSCRQRSTDGSTRNCTPIGTGTYTIASLGDTRTLSFTSLPAQLAAQPWERVFVERGGRVYYGYKNKPTVANQARLNRPAMDALLAKLGVLSQDPDVPLALTQSSYAGNWSVSDTSDIISNGTTIAINARGLITCRDNATNTPITCTVTLNPATGAFTYADVDGTATGTLDFLTGAASGTFTPAAGGAAFAIAGMRR